MSNRARPPVDPLVNVAIGPVSGDFEGDVVVARRPEAEAEVTALATGGVPITTTGTLPAGEISLTGTDRIGGRS